VTGKVWLVGAGPGDPGLITRRGLEVLQSCDVVLYDRLVPQALLEEAPAGAERVFVGKKPGETHSRQVIADALLIQRAQAGARVVRLKGGDPFVFGRGGEEALLLAQAAIPFEVVPGVSSAVAVPAYAGIPVTHRGVSGSFVVLTGRDVAGEPQQKWGATAGVDTIVLLMGASGLDGAARHLIAAGKDAATPAAVIEWGTTAVQRTVVAPLGSIAQAAAEAEIKPPATTVVGDVVRLRDAIAWFENRPLFGLRVVVTRAPPQASRLSARLAADGAHVIEAATIRIEDPDSFDELDAALASLGDYDWVVFASVNSVERAFARLDVAGRDSRAFASAAIAAVGDSTAAALRARGIRADLVPETFTGTALATALGGGAGRLLFPRAADAPRALFDALEGAGWKVNEVAAYRNVPADRSAPGMAEVVAGRFDVATFTSASTVRNLAAIASPDELGLGAAGPRGVACIGPVTAEAARASGFRVDVVAEPHTIDGLVAAIGSSLAPFFAQNRTLERPRKRKERRGRGGGTIGR
jgi:uroporphyrinogen III methyltransferase / synthase